jgi:hypothetical protein
MDQVAPPEGALEYVGDWRVDQRLGGGEVTTSTGRGGDAPNSAIVQTISGRATVFRAVQRYSLTASADDEAIDLSFAESGAQGACLAPAVDRTGP